MFWFVSLSFSFTLYLLLWYPMPLYCSIIMMVHPSSVCTFIPWPHCHQRKYLSNHHTQVLHTRWSHCNALVHLIYTRKIKLVRKLHRTHPYTRTPPKSLMFHTPAVETERRSIRICCCNLTSLPIKIFACSLLIGYQYIANRYPSLIVVCVPQVDCCVRTPWLIMYIS